MKKFDALLGAVLNKTTIRMRLELGKLFIQNNMDITVDQYVILSRLYEYPGISQNDLANMTYKDKSSITRILDLLEKKGFIERRTVKGDRRSYQIFTKEKAMQIKDQIQKLAISNIDKGIRNIDPSELEVTLRVLEKIHSNYSDI